MDTIKDKVEELIAAIQESAEYQNFQAAGERVKDIDGLEDKVREFCWKNYELQKSNAEDLYEKVEAFEEQYRGFRENPIVSEYLEYELRMCRLLQEINTRITSSVDLMI